MNRVFIIAEAGVNHNGDIELAKKLVETAAHAGADAVKFQTFKAEALVTKNAGKAAYQKKYTSSSENQFEMIKRLELTEEAHYELIDHCKKNRIEFLSSPFDLESIDFLNRIGLKTFKIPSGEINNVPYLKKIARFNKKVILSTGMSNLGEIEFALDILCNNGTQKKYITVLHCNTEYPTPFEDVNLKAMLTIQDALKVNIGYSDHTSGIEVPIAAAALGAKVIEKHFTLDKNMAGPDHKASLNPEELKKMIGSIRKIELALGTGIKKPSKSEVKNITIARKSIVALKEIKAGDTFSPDNITVKRPGNGLSPILWDHIIGLKARRNYLPDELIEQ